MAWDPSNRGRTQGGYVREQAERGTRDMATGRRQVAGPPRRGRSSASRRRARGRGRGQAPARGRPAPPPPPPDFAAIAQERYPLLGWMFQVPDLKNVLVASIQEGWSEQRLEAGLQNTGWWRSTPASVREWTQLKYADPATANRERVTQMAELKTLAHNYVIPISDATLNQWVEAQDPEGFELFVKNTAKGRFPGLAAAIDKGQTVEQFAAPYREIAAQTLEVAPDTVDFNNEKWMKALSHRTKEGQIAPMGLADWQRELKTAPQYGWDTTRNARQQASEVSAQLLQRFGGLGG